MGALPLALVHVRLDFADLPELRAEAEVHVFSRVLRPMGYMPLTGKHNMDDISTTSWLLHRDKGSISRAAPLPTVGRPERPGTRAPHGTQHKKGQDLLSPLHRVVCAACTPNRELPFPAPRAFSAWGFTANQTAGKQYRTLDWMGQGPLRRTGTYWH